MNILFVTARLPYPPLKGDQCIPYNRLKLLSKRHNISLLTFYQKDKELEYLKELNPFCKEIITVKLNLFHSFLNILFGIFFSKLPFQVLYYRSCKFKKALQSITDNRKFDLVHTYMLRMAEYTKDMKTPKVLDLIDLMQLSLKKRVSIEKFIRKLFFKEELKRITRYEKQMIAKFDVSILVSDSDKNYAKSNNAVAIPLGVDTDSFKRTTNLPHNKTIIFSGNMGYFPNETAINWFMKNCFPLIKNDVPDVKIIIAGNNPSSRVRALHNDSVFVTGFVQSMSETLSKAQIAITPMQSGYGMHIKLLEAMSCGLPVVCTSTALGTVKAIDGQDVLIADTILEFVSRCIELLKNYDFSIEVGNAARKTILREYSWKAHSDAIEKIYFQITNSKLNNRCDPQ